MKISLIISTYNRPDALRLCMLSAFAQKVLPDEIIIGDDGSDERTREAIDGLRSLSPVPIIHVWHEDNGFRLAMMRNKCVAVASGDYIVEVDGDVIMHPLFIKDHRDFAGEGYYLKGGRANLCQRSRKVASIEFLYTRNREQEDEHTPYTVVGGISFIKISQEARTRARMQHVFF